MVLNEPWNTTALRSAPARVNSSTTENTEAEADCGQVRVIALGKLGEGSKRGSGARAGQATSVKFPDFRVPRPRLGTPGALIAEGAALLRQLVADIIAGSRMIDAYGEQGIPAIMASAVSNPCVRGPNESQGPLRPTLTGRRLSGSVTNGCRTHQNQRLILALLNLLNRKCAAWRPQHPLSLTGAVVLIKPRLIRALRAVRSSERAVFHPV